ncbi:MAG TPA: sigma-54 dependent transcriptional regulator [Chthonomonadales bacterium]|nr:sigma-54 dependent transcriptional regulator [Chthonomonadales bacterium]
MPMKHTYTILVADDEPNIRRVLEALFTSNGFDVVTAGAGRKALEIARGRTIDALVSDLIMPDMNGVDLLREVKVLHPVCAAIIVTAYGTIRTAVDAMRLGAYDYITKPFDVDEVLQCVRRALDDVAAPASARAAPKAATPVPPGYEVLGASSAMRDLMAMVERVADSRATVLLAGESGTGKELIARALHFRSCRADKPFVPVSCAALSETLLESELFGHEKNAFTGAAALRHGRFEAANSGTLFLDEVAEIPPPLQVKLLRVLQEREFERVGGNKTIRVEVRLVSATNKDLEGLVANREFRDDLFYRLQVIQLRIPPLRERPEDVAELVPFFLAKYSSENRRSMVEVASDALDALISYRYPGNVRELENIIQRAVVIGDPSARTLTLDLLPDAVRRQAPAV